MNFKDADNSLMRLNTLARQVNETGESKILEKLGNNSNNN
jgi:hypothetical protein